MSQPEPSKPLPQAEPTHRFYNVQLPVQAYISEADVRKAYELELPWRLVWESPIDVVMGNDGKTLLLRCVKDTAYSGIVVGTKRPPGRIVSGIYAPIEPSSDSDTTLVTEPRSGDTTSSSEGTADTIPMNDSDPMDASTLTPPETSDESLSQSPSILGK